MEWAREIDTHLQTSQLILLLISADFLASDYCWGVELQEAMRRHHAGTALVLPILIRPVDWKEAPFSQLQALPRDNKAISSWPNRDEAFTHVAEGIRQAIQEMNTSYFTKQQTVRFTVQLGDITLFDADTVALKYAQDFFGADAEIASRMENAEWKMQEYR